MSGFLALLLCYVTYRLSTYLGGFLGFIFGFTVVVVGYMLTDRYRQYDWNAFITASMAGVVAAAWGYMREWLLIESLLLAAILVFSLQALAYFIVPVWQEARRRKNGYPPEE